MADAGFIYGAIHPDDGARLAQRGTFRTDLRITDGHGGWRWSAKTTSNVSSPNRTESASNPVGENGGIIK